MDNWSILGIEPTDDKNVIKEAYMERLSVVNPEDDPEGFKKLRNAYEILIKECEQAKNNEEDNSPLGLWIKKVEYVYENFSLRLNEENWQKLLNDDICFSLDSCEETSERLLTYLMDNFRFPQKIWVLLNDNFEWTENKKELYEKFPYEFINYIESRVKYTDALNYDLFEDIHDSKPYDQWIAEYYKLKQDINNWQLDEAQKDLKEILSISIYHPYLDVQKARIEMEKENIDEAFEIMKPLFEKYQEDAAIIYEMAEIKYKQKKYEEAEKLYNKVLEHLPDDYNASIGLADCRMEIGSLEEAKDIYIALNRRNNYDNYIRQQIFEVNNRLIAKYESEDAKDSENIFAHSWCLYENCRFKEILELLKDFVVPEEDEEQYIDLMGRVNDGLGNHEESIKSYNKWLEKLKIKYKNNEEIDMTINALKYVYYQIGRQYTCLENYKTAIENYDAVLKLDEENVNALDLKSRALIKLGKNDGALVTAEKGLEIDNRNVNLHITKAEALLELGYDGDALDAAIDAENIYPYAYRCYSIQMELYGSHGEVDNVLETYDRAEKYNAVDDNMKVLKVKALKEKKMYGEAEASAFKFLEDSKDNNEEFQALDELYYEISCIYIETGKLEEGLKYSNKAINLSPEKTKFYYVRAYAYKALEKYDDSLKDYDYVIKNDSQDTFAYEKEASIYKTLGKFDEALKILFKILDLNPEHDYINNEIGEIYDSKDDYKNALKYYTAQIELKSSAYYLVNRGLLYDRFNKTDDAIADYKKAIELEPDVPHAYNNLGLIYKSRREFNKAIKCFEKAIEKTGDVSFKQFYNNIGNTYTDLCKFENALKYYNEGIKHLPEESSLYLNKGKALSNLRRYKEAIKAFEAGIKLENADLEGFYDEMADVYICIKEYDTAVKYYEKVIEINPQHLFAYRQMGDVYCDDIKDYDKAIQCYLKQIKIKDGNPKDFLALAQAYEKAGKKIRARRYFKKALAIYEPRKEEEAYFKYKCAECYKGLKKINVAFEYLNKAIEKPCFDCDRNGCYEAYYKMGQIYEEAGNYEEAYKCYLKTYELCDNIEQYIDALDRIKKILNID